MGNVYEDDTPTDKFDAPKSFTHCGRCSSQVVRRTIRERGFVIAAYECSHCDRAHGVLLQIGDNKFKRPVGDVFDYSKAAGPFGGTK